jgi:hypothetical protein
MNVRPFDWRDLHHLHRNRQQAIFLDSVSLLTRGPLLLPSALLSYLAPGMGVFTCINNGDGEEAQPLIGQFTHAFQSHFAHLTFLTPQAALESSASHLLDYLVWISGQRGALHLLADVDERSGAFEALRRDGFATYSRQRIWQLAAGQQVRRQTAPASQKRASAWRSALSRDALAIRSLYANLVPGLVQQVEPLLNQPPRGLVYSLQDRLLAYVELKVGRRGVWAQPFVHPDAERISDLLTDLIHRIPNRRARPLYLCVRSYQAWLEAAIEELGAQPGPRQAVMVRHLAIQQKVERKYALPALEGGRAEVSTPILGQIRSERE